MDKSTSQRVFKLLFLRTYYPTAQRQPNLMEISIENLPYFQVHVNE